MISQGAIPKEPKFKERKFQDHTAKPSVHGRELRFKEKKFHSESNAKSKLMYVTISPQKSVGHYASSCADCVNYLEKENEHVPQEEKERFFNATDNDILPESVTSEIDGNTAKLKTSEARFYSITINPSSRALAKLRSTEQLKEYTRELMKSYASCFNREIDGRKVQPSDIKYFAKLETQRHFKGTDWQVKENQHYATKILELKNQVRKFRVERSREVSKF